jgi:hypothetical protein
MYVHRAPSSTVYIGSDIFIDQLTLTTVNATQYIGEITIPAGLQGSLKYAFLDFNFASVYNTWVGANATNLGVSAIQLQDTLGGGWFTGISMAGDNLRTTVQGSYFIGTLIGNLDISSNLTIGHSYHIQWLDSQSLHNSLIFTNIQAIIRLVLE